MHSIQRIGKTNKQTTTPNQTPAEENTGEFCFMVKEKNQLKTVNVQVMGRRFRAEEDNKRCSVT